MPKDKHTGKDWLNYLLLGLFLYIAYLPLSSLLFAVKNDALTENFPPKYFFSAALHSGHLPLWNPYMNFGLPVYADPGFAFWNPLTWLFGAIGYTPRLLSIEILTYIWLAGIFMYRLGLYLGHSRLTAFLMGMLFMCCGFFIGHLAHTNFITCAAFLPLVTQTFMQAQTSPSPKRLFFAAASICLLITGGHPAIPIGTIYFLVALLIGRVLTTEKEHRIPELKDTARTNLLLLLTVLGLSAPVWLSWAEIWPYFNRASPIFQLGQQGLGFTVRAWISFLFPFATTAKTGLFGTVGYMRNGYISFIGFALLLVALAGKKNKTQLIFLGGGILMLLLSLGSPVKSILYSHLPLLEYIRTNGEFRVFTLFSFIIILSWPLENMLATGKIPQMLDRLLLVFLSLSIIAIIVVFATSLRHGLLPAYTPMHQIKQLIEFLPLPTRLLINAVILLGLLSTYYLLRKKLAPKTLIPALIIADLVILCWIQIPITGVQQKSPGAIRDLLSDAPPGIPLPKLTPIAGNVRPGLERIVGRWSYYSKQPGAPILCDYPVLFHSTGDYFNSRWPDSLNHRPFVFLAQSPEPPALEKFSPASIAITTTTSQPDTLVLLQNDFPRWQTSLDNQPCPHIRTYGAFMGIIVPPGSHHLLFRFSTTQLLWYMLIPLATMLILLIAAKRPQRPPKD